MPLIKVDDVPFSWFRKELKFTTTLKKGTKSKRVKFIQECLSLSGNKIVIDQDFGPATEQAIRNFQRSEGLSESGKIGKDDFSSLIKPFLRALTPLNISGSLSELTASYAAQHLAEHPREVGGQNRGPWVRLYMGGNEGNAWPWCAGFVTLVVRQASEFHNEPNAVKRTYSCDVLAERAKTKHQFVSENVLKKTKPSSDVLPTGTLFLNRKSSFDWTHTGFVIDAGAETFTTIEGNTNDEGSNEGYEVCRRTRGYKKKDFVVY